MVRFTGVHYHISYEGKPPEKIQQQESIGTKGTEMTAMGFAAASNSQLVRDAFSLCIICWGIAIAQHAVAQDQAKRNEAKVVNVDPRSFGLSVVPGPIRDGGGRRVVTNDEQGNAVTGVIHTEVGSSRVVLLPDGTLVARPTTSAPLTECPFVPAATKDIAERIISTDLRGFEGFKWKETRRYVYIYNTTEEFALTTSRIMETMFKGVVRHAMSQKIDVHEPQVPMIVIMFANEGEYQRYRRMPDGIVAYYHILSNHVVMFEKPSRSSVKPELDFQQAVATIAHEGTHQILHNIGVQQRLSVWPMWLAEGYAEYLAPTSTGKRLRWKGAGQINDMRMFELEEYMKSRSSDELDGETIKATTGARRLSSTGYASAWSLTHFLSKNPRFDLDGYINKMSKLAPLQAIDDNAQSFVDHFGDDLATMEKLMFNHLKKQKYVSPFAEYPHYVVMITYQDGRELARVGNMFYRPDVAQRWRQDTIVKIPAAQRSTINTVSRVFPNRLSATQVLGRFLNGN